MSDPFKNFDQLPTASLADLQQAFNEMDAHVQVAEPQVLAMKQTYEEAQMILDSMKYKRGKVAYWLTIRKAQR